MKLPESWLRTYANPPIDSATLADRLTMSGLEVEELAPVAPPFSKVVVGHVKSVERHPNADKLTVCDVDAGTGATLRIVCGAPNVVAGMRAPVALPGAVLPGGVQIRPTQMRGVESQGMLCSARELGLSEDHTGLLALRADAPIGADVRGVLALDDHALTIKLTPNRGDCLSVLGIAREVAAITGAKLAARVFEPVPPTIDERLPVRVLAPDLCGRFSGRVIRGLNARAETPDWMKQRLERCGQRPISALVDISNYVMLELGRPSHVFDLDRVDGGLEVRWGRAGETLELLSGQTVEVDGTVGVIADRRGVVESLAGIMGGESTAVTLDTQNIYLEAAFWWPESIQGRSRRFNFATDAGHRFERGVDYATTVEHIEYITRLILDICGTPATRVGPVDDSVVRLPERPAVRLRAERCRRVLGVDIPTGDMASTLARLGLPCTRQKGGNGADEVLVVTPPSYRFDLVLEEDLIEEVARLWGFDRIPAHPPLAAAAMRGRPEAVRPMHELRHELAGAGYQELVNFSFVDEDWERDFAAGGEPIRVVNPIASQMSVMRTTLIGGLVAKLRDNLNRKALRVRVFELGRVFHRDPGVPDGELTVAGIAQPNRIAGLAYGTALDEQWGVPRRDVDFYDVKGDVERLLAGAPARFVAASHPALHPGRNARIELNGEAIGWIGELHPRWMQKYDLPKPPVVFELDVEPLTAARLPSVAPVPRFQPVLRDIAFWVDDHITLQQVLDAVLALARKDERLRTLRAFRPFDLYRPGSADSSKFAEAGANALLNKDKSLAFRVVLQDTDRTLSDADADAALAAISTELKTTLNARLRE